MISSCHISTMLMSSSIRSNASRKYSRSRCCLASSASMRATSEPSSSMISVSRVLLRIHTIAGGGRATSPAPESHDLLSGRPASLRPIARASARPAQSPRHYGAPVDRPPLARPIAPSPRRLLSGDYPAAAGIPLNSRPAAALFRFTPGSRHMAGQTAAADPKFDRSASVAAFLIRHGRTGRPGPVAAFLAGRAGPMPPRLRVAPAGGAGL